MMQDHPQPVRMTRSKGPSLFDYIFLFESSMYLVQPSRLCVSTISTIICTKAVTSLVPVYVTPFQIGSWRPFFLLRSNQIPRSFSFSIPVRIRILLFLSPPPCYFGLSNTPTSNFHLPNTMHSSKRVKRREACN